MMVINNTDPNKTGFTISCDSKLRCNIIVQECNGILYEENKNYLLAKKHKNKY